MLEKVPGSYVFVGNGGPGSPGACMVHNPGYDFDDSNIAVGSAYWVRLAQRYLV
jgi:hippurate hydrolase